jgi:hypothetical protein
MSYLSDFEILDVSALNDFVARQQEENLNLEFKLVKDAGLSTREDKQNLARALSGFANSSGGLIVWGMESSKNADGIDCAIGLRPIKPIALTMSRLNSLTGEGASPIVEQVRHRSLELGDGSGFVLTVIPESDLGPHMAKLGENCYYKRSGDSFYLMEHYDIADMFGRRRKPKLTVFFRVVHRSPNPKIHLGILNIGRATARAPFFAFENSGPLTRDIYGLDGNRNEGLNMLRAVRSGLKWAYGGGMDFALHPGMSVEVAGIAAPSFRELELEEDVIVDYAVSCEEQPLERGKIIIPASDLKKV